MIRAIFAGGLVSLGLLSLIGYNVTMGFGEDSQYVSVNGQVMEVPSSQAKLSVEFSHEKTFYGENISVEFKATEADAVIYFTSDGSDPTTNSKTYTEPIEINAKSEVMATTFKVMAATADKNSEIITKSYVVGKDVDKRFSEDTYVFVLSTDDYNLYDYKYGIAVPGKIYDDYVKEHPGEEIPYNAPGNYYMNGKESERPMYVEVYNSNGKQLISQAAGVRVVGGYSRVVNQKSLKLVARKSYDPENGKFKYAFFDEAVDANGVPITEFDRIVLRNGANDRDFAQVRDELSQSLAQDAGFSSTQGTAPAAVFLNGKYYGYAWLHQNYNESYLEDQFGGAEENYEIVSNTEQADEGEKRGLTAYEEIKYLINETDFSDIKNYKKFCELVDIDNFTLYYAIQIFVANRDWPGNNYKVWRYFPSKDEEITSDYLDGKWRYLLFDAEFGWGLYGNGYNDTTIRDLLNGTHMGGASQALINLTKRPEFCEKLSNTLCDLMSGAFSYNNIIETLDKKVAESNPECMYALDNGYTSEWASRSTFAESRQQIVDFAQNRPNVVKSDISRSFGVEKTYYTIMMTGAKGATAKLNTLTTNNLQAVSGTYFTAYEVPLDCKEYSGYKFDYWLVNGSKYIDRNLKLKASMKNSDGIINVELKLKKVASSSEILYISEISTEKNNGWIELYNPNDTEISTKGFYISDDAEVPKRFKLPTVTIAPHSTLVIVSNSNKNTDALMKIQADFSWKESESAVLCDQGGHILSNVIIPPLDKGKTYTRETGGKYAIKAASMGAHEE